MTYHGLSQTLRLVVYARDRYRCRWCGQTGAGVDLHHVRYRRGEQDDTADNLITLCRLHHNYVHGLKVAADTITKAEAQEVLAELIATPGITGLAVRRRQANAARATRTERTARTTRTTRTD